MYVAVETGSEVIVAGGITGLAIGAVGAPGGIDLVQLEMSSANRMIARKRFMVYPGDGSGKVAWNSETTLYL
jgi:hypothetical protein